MKKHQLYHFSYDTVLASNNKLLAVENPDDGIDSTFTVLSKIGGATVHYQMI